MIPLYGFAAGDTIGLLVLADENDTMAVLADKLQRSASVRVAPRVRVHVEVRGARLHPSVTVARAGLTALDRFDVREGE
jgi:NAD kinase